MNISHEIPTKHKVDFLLEIGVEEIPSALINNIKDSIASGIEALLNLHKLSFDYINLSEDHASLMLESCTLSKSDESGS